jgi:predicted CoA-substrate-specific enzyme activase
MRKDTVEALWGKTLSDAGLTPDSVCRAVSTGQGKYDVPFADRAVTDSVAAAAAARFLYPHATAVIDAGADQTRVVALGEGRTIKNVTTNQKCMAGLGLMLEIVAKRLEMDIDEFGSAAPFVGDTLPLNDGCPVFAEEGVLELLNDGVPKAKIATAATGVAAVRLNAILHDKITPDKNGTVFIGGLAKNAAVVAALKVRSGIDFLIPEDAEYGAAIGAAAIAASLAA